MTQSVGMRKIESIDVGNRNDMGGVLMKRGIVLLPFALALLAAPAFTETIELQQGVNNYSGTQDAHIISWDGSENQLIRKDDGSNGGNGTALAGGNPQNAGSHTFIEEGDYGSGTGLVDDSKCILIQFDLSGISAKNVTRAKIGLYYWYERSTGSDATEMSGTKKAINTLYVNRILKKWAQGTSTTGGGVDGDETADNTGEVTWNSTGFELWQAMGAEGPADIAPTESVTLFDPAVGGWTWFDVTQSVRMWLADPASNNGVKIGQEAYPAVFLEPDLTLADGTVVYRAAPTATPTGFVGGAHDFISSENTGHADLRPKLVLEGASSASDWEIFE